MKTDIAISYKDTAFTNVEAVSFFHTIGNCAKPTSPFVSFRYRKAWIGEQLRVGVAHFLYRFK